MDYQTQALPSHTGAFGLYRWLMTCVVVMAHLGCKQAVTAGFYAVFGFYALSGYLITLVYTEHYACIASGVKRYMLNRFLRIFPVYWAAIAIAVIIALLYPAQTRLTHPLYGIPTTLAAWIGTVSLEGVVNIIGVRPPTLPVTTAWSLKAECLFYLALPAMLRYPHARLFLLTLALGYPLIAPGNVFALYYSPFAAGLPFAVGMGIYYLHRKQQWRVSNALCNCAAILLLALSVLGGFMVPTRFTLYLALACNGVIIRFLSQVNPALLSTNLRGADRMSGNVTYAIYLIHVPIGALCYALLQNHIHPDSMALYCVAFLPVQLVAFLMYFFIEKPINQLRIKVKSETRTV